ncbi:MAG TPA: hypothetical protein VGJ78_24730 [Vicinamibacterales bacterium]|jgi:hypothetical protein
MQRRVFSTAGAIATLVVPTLVYAQAASNAVADLSGDWFHPVVLSISPADARGTKRGNEGDVPYRPETLKAMMAETPATGADGRFELTTDPYIQYCEPLGLVRMFGYPSKTRFVQTPEAVYILDEIGPTFRIVWLNAKHPDDPDPQYWGHSIGWYENGDTLVVDTVGVNSKTWFDQVGHPHSDQLHLVERFTRAGDRTLAYRITIDDPGACTRTWTSGPRTFTRSDTGFLRYQWVCSTRDTREHYEKVGSAGNPGTTSTFK